MGVYCLVVGGSCINSPHFRHLFISRAAPTCGNRFQSNFQIPHKIAPSNWQYMRVQAVRIVEFPIGLPAKLAHVSPTLFLTWRAACIPHFDFVFDIHFPTLICRIGFHKKKQNYKVKDL